MAKKRKQHQLDWDFTGLYSTSRELSPLRDTIVPILSYRVTIFCDLMLFLYCSWCSSEYFHKSSVGSWYNLVAVSEKQLFPAHVGSFFFLPSTSSHFSKNLKQIGSLWVRQKYIYDTFQSGKSWKRHLVPFTTENESVTLKMKQYYKWKLSKLRLTMGEKNHKMWKAAQQDTVKNDFEQYVYKEWKKVLQLSGNRLAQSPCCKSLSQRTAGTEFEITLCILISQKQKATTSWKEFASHRQSQADKEKWQPPDCFHLLSS